MIERLKKPLITFSISITLALVALIIWLMGTDISQQAFSVSIRIFIIIALFIGASLLIGLVAKERKRGIPYPKSSLLSFLGGFFLIAGLLFFDYPFITWPVLGLGIILLLTDATIRKRRNTQV